MTILEKRLVYAPFEYQTAYDYWLKQQMHHWLPQEIPMGPDINDWKHNLSSTEREVIGRILKGFTQAEVLVEDYWATKITRWFKKPEIQMMSAAFSSMESVHSASYAYLQESLGLLDFDAFLYEPSAKAKIDRLLSTRGKSREEMALSLAVFSAFTEGVNLFSSFAILLSFSRKNLLKGMGQIISYSIKDECIAEGAEVLTPSGWKDLSKVTTEDKIAQFNLDRTIDFVNPSRIVRKEHKGEMIHFYSENRNVDLLVTPNHRMVLENKIPGSLDRDSIQTNEAVDTKFHAYNNHLTSGFHKNGKNQLTALERFKIAYQADGRTPDGLS